MPLSRIADEFWLAAGGREPYPRNLEVPTTWALPLAIVKLPRLWFQDVKAWLFTHGSDVVLSGHNRQLRACLIAYRGKGFVLLDGTDSRDHQRYSLAHEIAHFLLDYLLPREDAIRRFGDSILEVLDGFRSATDAERLGSVLSDTCIRPHVHLMDRREDGSFGSGSITISESNADRLAIELLAPAQEVRKCIERLKHTSQDGDLSRNVRQFLRVNFGLPKLIAREYGDWLCRQNDVDFSIRKWLGV